MDISNGKGREIMARYFEVRVSHYATSLVETFIPTDAYDWQCRVNGEKFYYKVISVVRAVPNYFERGTQEALYHSNSEAHGGVVLWDKRPKWTNCYE
jgi:hypothetical protein